MDKGRDRARGNARAAAKDTVRALRVPAAWVMACAFGIASLACALEDQPPPLGAGGRAAEAVTGRGGAGGGISGGVIDAGVRDGQPYERPPAAAMVTGHTWAWNDVGVGAGETGSSRFGSSVLTIRAGGAGLKGAADGLGMASVRLRGDGEIVARVRSLQMVDPESTAGLIVRGDASTPGAVAVFVGILGDATRGGQVVVRRTLGGPAEVVATDVGIRAGQFLRLRRTGKKISVARSPDRLAWVPLAAVDVELPVEAFAGVAVSAARSGMLAVAEIDQLRAISVDAAGAALGLELEPMAGNGAVASVTGSEISLVAGGDNFVTVGEPGIGLFATLSGSQTITARIDVIETASPTGPSAMKARVGLTFREGGIGRTTPLARHALISLDAAGKVAFQRRDRSTNFDSGAIVATMPKRPMWLRLVRYDDPVTFRTRVMGLLSSDGVTFTPVDSVELKLADPMLVGILSTSGDGNLHTTVRLSDVSISAIPMPIAPLSDAGVDAVMPATDTARDLRPDGGVDAPIDVGPGQ